MFDVFCPTHGKRVLLTSRRIEKMENTPAGIVVTWRCWCGTRGESCTGRRWEADHGGSPTAPRPAEPAA